MTIGADIYKYIEAHLRLNYPSHSQIVEHAVQITTSVALLLTYWESDTRAVDTRVVDTRAVDARVVDTRAAIYQKVDTMAAVSYHIINTYLYVHIYLYSAMLSAD